MVNGAVSKLTLSNVLSTAQRYGNYGANFIFGTGSNIVGDEIRTAVKSRKATGQSITSAITNGFSKGVTKSNTQVAQTGFVKSVQNAFSSLPNNMKNGWKTAGASSKSSIGKFFSKLGNAIKPIGNVLPFAFNAFVAATYIPSIMERAQDQGIWGGIKETVKSIGKLGLYALGSAVGAAGGIIGSFAGVFAAGCVGDAIFGKDYSTQKEEQQNKLLAYTQATAQQSRIDYEA